ncbi:DUF2474 family protein [Microbulbifer sp.]|nr:DUF2474 family protein [Microbulbifer sp.]
MKLDVTTWKRLGWMIAIWVLSVAALGSVSLLLKWWLTG